MLDKFFNVFFSLPLIRKFKPFYQRRKDLVLYAFFGILTTAVSFIAFWISEILLKNIPYHEFISNTFSWIFAVEFAFFTNRRWVFHSPTKTFYAFIRQMALFYTGRLFSFLVETFILWVFVTILDFNALLIKAFATLVVLIMNYVISKLVVFRQKTSLAEVTND